jgi:hypothetical protein
MRNGQKEYRYARNKFFVSRKGKNRNFWRDVTHCCILQWEVRSYRGNMQRGVESYHRMRQREVSLAAGSSLKIVEDYQGP